MKNLLPIKATAIGKTEIAFPAPSRELQKFLQQIGDCRAFVGMDLGSGEATAVCLVHPDGRIEQLKPEDYFDR